MTSVLKLTRWGAARLTASPTPQLDSEVLLAHVLNCNRAELYARIDPPSWWQTWRFRRLIAQRGRGVPAAYLTGHKEFFGLDFLVNRHVLIPRPETETIVKRALRLIQEWHLPIVYEVGTGSGNIAVALAHHLPGLRVVASDAFKETLAVARRNARRHGVEGRIELVHADLGQHITEADLVVANLPYVPTDYKARREIFFEPAQAVFVKDDGLALYKQFLIQTKFRLAVIELGPWQLDRLLPWLTSNLPHHAVEVVRDESGYVCGLQLTAPGSGDGSDQLPRQ